jgi:hypothetical protein
MTSSCVYTVSSEKKFLLEDYQSMSCDCIAPLDAISAAQLHHTARLLKASLLSIPPAHACVFDIDETILQTHCFRCHKKLARMRPIAPMVDALKACYARGHPVHFVTSRYGNAANRRYTREQLIRLCDVPLTHTTIRTLHMRPTNDHRPTELVKADLRKSIRAPIALSAGDHPGDIHPGSLPFPTPNPAYKAF